MYELDEHGDLTILSQPISMPTGRIRSPYDQRSSRHYCRPNMTLYVMVLNYHLVLFVTMTLKLWKKLLKLFGYGKDVIEEKFAALYNAFQFGAPPHAGIAPGVDRILMLLTESETIRDVIAFPMNSKAQDLMMGAPGNVTREQLQDVHIKLDLPKDSFTNRISSK